MNNITISIVVIIAVIVVAFLFYQRAHAPDAEIGVEQIATEVAAGEAILLDVRTDEELANDGYALGSTHFDIARLRDGELPNISTNTKVYTYCKAGGRAGEAETILEDAGFNNVENIGGLSDWEASGGNVVRQ